MKSRLSRREFMRFSAGLLVSSLLPACGQTVKRSQVHGTREITPTVEINVKVLADGLDFPEGPAFDLEGNLWCTELGAGNLVRWSEGKVERIPTQGRPNGLSFDRQGRAWVCDSGQNSIRRYTPETGVWKTIVDNIDGLPLQSPNDLAFDRDGNLVFTCPNFADTRSTGYVCCLKPDQSIHKIAEGLYRPNGLDFLPGGEELVIADTYQKSLFKGDWDAAKCDWKNEGIWADVDGAEGPDGMVPCADGMLYVAVFGLGVIKALDANGKLVNSYSLPGNNPTNVAVDPSGKLGLVVTEAEKGLLLSLPDIKPGVAVYDGGEAWP